MPTGLAMNLGNLEIHLLGDNSMLAKSLRDAEKMVEKTSDKMIKLGKKMSLAVTTPLVALGGIMIKLASDAEEIDSKFAVTFSNIQKNATSAMKTLDQAYGLNQTEAKRLLSGTGDLLTGFGFAQEEALKLSFEVQKLSVDLASFQNLQGGATRASEALTKAMLGERESAKLLGIVIREVDVEAEILKMQQEGLTFATLNQAKAEATLRIAMRQSKNAIGDYARTQEQFANQFREMVFDIKDAAIAFGSIMLPIATRLVGVFKDLANWAKELDDSTKKFIIGIVAITAAIGPLLLAMGLLLKYGIAISAMFVTWAPVAIAIGAIAVAIWAITDALTEADLGIVNFLRNIEIAGTDLGTWLDATATYFWQTWDWIANKSKMAWEGFVIGVKGIWNGLKIFILEIGKAISDGIWDGIKSITFGFTQMITSVTKNMKALKLISADTRKGIVERARQADKDVIDSANESSKFYKDLIKETTDENTEQWAKYYSAIAELDAQYTQQAAMWAQMRADIFAGEGAGAGMRDVVEGQTKMIKKEADRQAEIEKEKNDTILAGTSALFGAAAAIAQAGGKKNFKLYQGMAMGEAAMSTYLAFDKALASGPGPPWTIPLASAVLAMGFLKVRAIAMQKPGGGFSAGGGGGGAGGFGATPVTPSLEEPRGVEEEERREERWTVYIENIHGSADEEFADLLADKIADRSKDGRDFGFVVETN